MIRLSAPVTLAADNGGRTIEGMALHYDTVIQASTGPVMFLAGSLPTEGTPPKLLRDHDPSQPLGLVTERWATPDGVAFRAKISATAAGDEALTLAADGVLDSVSVGVQPVDFIRQDGVMVVAAGAWMELSLLPWGADPNAKISHVAASPAEVEESTTPNPNPSEEEPMSENIEAAPAEVVATAPIFAGQAPAFIKRPTAAEYMAYRLGADLPHVRAALQDTADSTGILPEDILGPVYDGLRADRPFCDSIGVEAMPGSGKTFTIPKITTRPTVAAQANEGDALSSTAMVVQDVTVTKSTLGGAVSLSEQDIDWTNPAALQLTLEQLAKAYARQTEAAACAALIAGATVTDTITSWTDATEIIGSIFAAATTIVSATGSMPTHIWCAPDRFKDLAILKTSGGDFLFPSLNPMNAYGTLNAGALQGTPAGLRLVVSPQFAAGKFVVGNADGIRLFEQRKGAVMVNQPNTLTVDMAWRGYFATAFMDTNKFVEFV